ncbi:MAG: CoA transferase, partial [Halobacteria archaeon]|nr:CoA transferase [Halobacteria archaeon]
GAEVVKIEDTEAGDYARYVDPFLDGVGGMFSMVNRGKKSVTLDLKSDEGREAFMRMAEDADVVFEQFRPGVVERLGVGYEDVKERNPDVVYCSLSGYGATGQRNDEPGHDLNYAGYSGLLDMTRGGDDEPTIPGYPVADMSAGLFAAFSIVSAL